jgi:hypothetical protein
MSLWEKQEDIEQALEAKTDDVERHERNISEVESKLRRIESAMSGISEDGELRSKLENNLNERQRELHDEERNAETLRNELDSLLTLVNEREKINAESAAELDTLRVIGENVEDAEKIIQERKAWARETKHKIGDLRQRLGAFLGAVCATAAGVIQATPGVQDARYENRPAPAGDVAGIYAKLPNELETQVQVAEQFAEQRGFILTMPGAETEESKPNPWEKYVRDFARYAQAEDRKRREEQRRAIEANNALREHKNGG